MSLVPLKTHISPDQPLYAPIGGGGGGGTINVSTINIQANGDINWDGTLNFQGTNGGVVSLTSTIFGNPGNGIQITGNATNNSSTINMYVGGDGKAYLVLDTPNQTLNMPGASIAGLSTLQAAEASLSSINGTAYPPTAQTGVRSVVPLSGLTYIQGGQTANLFNLAGIQAQHSYRLEFPARIQAWNAADGLTNSYAPLPTDWIDFYTLGNVVGNPTPVFTTLQMAQISSISNNWEGTLSCVWKTGANQNELIVANTSPSVVYSTSVEIGSFGYLTDLGAI